MACRNLISEYCATDIMNTFECMLNSRFPNRYSIDYPRKWYGKQRNLTEMELTALTLSVGEALYGPHCVCVRRTETSESYVKEGNAVMEYEGEPFIIRRDTVFNFQNSTGKGYPMNIKKVVHNDPATIVIWEDGSKTVVKCGPGDIYDPEKGLAMAIVKRAYGDKGSYYEIFKKFAPVELQETCVEPKTADRSTRNIPDLAEILREIEKLSGNAKLDDEKKEKK